MDFFRGIQYNIQGLTLSLRHPKLLWLGLLRFAVILMLTVLLSGMILLNHDAILSGIWALPESGFLVYVWHLVAWLLSLVLAAISVVIAYLVAQVCFNVFIMDYMSRITEKIVLGKEVSPVDASWLKTGVYLIVQEIPRAVIPMVITLAVMTAGFFTPLGPVIFVVSAVTAGVFLAWDNTDLVPARQMQPFRERLRFLRQHLAFHIGFGLLLIIPWLNILTLSFAPVGATLYHIHKREKEKL
ncbi:MAG: EI24 domain-containing protein [Desulfotignum sp.]|nr:EI24 domain-containing protein [Desulfotignum sp.]